MRVHCSCTAFFLSVPATLAACTAPPLQSDLSSPRVVSRVPALVAKVDAMGAGPEGTPELRAADVAELVARLDDPEPAVRAFAIEGLHRLTDQRFGYRWHQSAEQRQPAIAAWRHWALQR